MVIRKTEYSNCINFMDAKTNILAYEVESPYSKLIFSIAQNHRYDGSIDIFIS